MVRFVVPLVILHAGMDHPGRMGDSSFHCVPFGMTRREAVLRACKACDIYTTRLFFMVHDTRCPGAGKHASTNTTSRSR